MAPRSRPGSDEDWAGVFIVLVVALWAVLNEVVGAISWGR